MAIVSSRLLLLFPASILFLIAQATAQPSFSYQICSDEEGNYTTNSVYAANLNHLLSSISFSTNITNGFYSKSHGEDPDKVYAIGLCRGDIEQDACLSCLNDSRIALPQLCPNQKGAIGWYDNCSLRFSNHSTFGILAYEPRIYAWNIMNVSDIDGYGRLLKTQFDDMINKVALDGSGKFFATRTSLASDLSKIYVLTQCTPDLTEEDCRNCLWKISGEIPECCVGKKGARYYAPSCNFRYESYPFFYQKVAAASPPPEKRNSIPRAASTGKRYTIPLYALHVPEKDNFSLRSGKERNNRTAIIIVVPTLILLLLLVGICIFLRKKRRNKCEMEDPVAMDEITSVESLQFDLSTIKVATNNFSDANKLGKGGFGIVYKGILSNKQEIAVKRLLRNSTQGDIEFKNEVLLVAKLQHRNLVRLLGFCLEGNERLLVYEFVPNTSLDHYIFDPVKHADLDWGRYNKIINGIARGLLYLHEDSRLRIIHRDLKAGNILLDTTMNPKISDFGMARLVVLDQIEGSTNRIVGTYGYMAPEYAMFGQFSTKSDVFSFGILILEIVSGRRITSLCDNEHLLSYAWRNWKEGATLNLINPTLLKSGPVAEMIRCIHIALLCVQQNVADRPDMALVVHMLKSDSTTLSLPTEPASFLQSRIQLATPEKLSINGGITNNEVSITELYPRWCYEREVHFTCNTVPHKLESSFSYATWTKATPYIML